MLREAKRNPKILIDKGILEYQHLTEQLVDDGNMSPQALERKIREEMQSQYSGLAKELENIKKEREKQAEIEEQRQLQAFVSQKRHEVQELFSSDPDKYELCLSVGNPDEVLNIIGLAAMNKGIDLTVQEAADLLEDYYHEQGTKIRATKKFTPKEPVSVTEAPRATRSPTPNPKNMAAPRPAEPPRKMTTEERREAAIRAMREARAAANLGKR